MKPVLNLSHASIEEDDECIIPVKVDSVPEPKQTELTQATNYSMSVLDVTIVTESDDDRPLINLAGLSTKKSNDGKGDRVCQEWTAFTDTLSISIGEVATTGDTGIVDGSNIAEDSKIARFEENICHPQTKVTGKEALFITEPSPLTIVSTQSSNKVKRAHRKSMNRIDTHRGNTDIWVHERRKTVLY